MVDVIKCLAVVMSLIDTKDILTGNIFNVSILYFKGMVLIHIFAVYIKRSTLVGETLPAPHNPSPAFLFFFCTLSGSHLKEGKGVE